MKTRKLYLMILVLAALHAGCSDESVVDDAKPMSDPDVELSDIDISKGDFTSSWLTTRQGDFNIGDEFKLTMDYPDWYHGHTVELRAGQRISFSVTATEEGPVRLYGPAVDERWGEPRFTRAAWADETRFDGQFYNASFTVDVAEDGVYMVVYGPRYVWESAYKIQSLCLDGCLPSDACGDDSECKADEFCGDNGVRCVNAPCSANYDVCRPKQDLDAGCQRDAMCAAGLSCVQERCAEGNTVGAACEQWDECQGSFCGCVDGTCSAKVCKAYAPEGGGCGGYVMPQHVRVCSPEFSCVGPSFIADLPGNCGARVTVAELLRNPAAWDGRFVVVDGYVQNGVPMCTKMACPPDNPCCNSCGASQFLLDDDQQPSADSHVGIALAKDGEAYGCGGDECNMHQGCTTDEGWYHLGGWFAAGEFTNTLQIERSFYSPTPAERPTPGDD